MYAQQLAAVLLLAALGNAGCESSTQDPAAGPSAVSVEDGSRQYPIVGNVVSVAEDRSSVTLDHEDIPGLMPGMEMEFQIADPLLLEGIAPGDRVEGQLEVDEGAYTIVTLQKQ